MSAKDPITLSASKTDKRYSRKFFFNETIFYVHIDIYASLYYNL